MAKLADRLNLPGGWQVRARALDIELELELDGNVKTVIDDLKNVYNLVPGTE